MSGELDFAFEVWHFGGSLGFCVHDGFGVLVIDGGVREAQRAWLMPFAGGIHVVGLFGFETM